MFDFLKAWNKNAGTTYDEPVRIAVIGLGYAGHSNVKQILASPNFRLTGVFDLDVDLTTRTARAASVTPYRDIDACLGDESSEAIFVSIPHDQLAGIGKRVLEAGKHLLIEKPMAIDMRSAAMLTTVAEKRRLSISVHYSRIFNDNVLAARRLVEIGTVGDLVSIETRLNAFKGPAYYHGVRGASPSNWRSDKMRSGGGILIMNGCHVIHAVQYITGAKVEWAFSAPPRLLPGDVPDGVEGDFYGLLGVEGGGVWTLSISGVKHGMASNDTLICGRSGSIMLQQERIQFYSTRVVEGKKPGVWHRLRRRPSDACQRWLDDVAQSIRKGTPLRTNAENARRTLKVINALYASSTSNRVVTMEEVQETASVEARPVQSQSGKPPLTRQGERGGNKQPIARMNVGAVLKTIQSNVVWTGNAKDSTGNWHRIALRDNGNSSLTFITENTELAEVSVPASFAGAMWGIYLLAMHLVDLARLSPGHSVVVAGCHLIDAAAEALLGCNMTVTVLSEEEASEAPIDAFIGCSIPALARVLPRMSTGGVLVCSCTQVATLEMNFYSIVHRKGLTITGQVGDAFLRDLPTLGRRLNRLMCRYGRLAAAYRRQSQHQIAR